MKNYTIIYQTKIGIVLSILCFTTVFSQQTISLENAIEKAFNNNLLLKSGQLKSEYQDKIKKSNSTIDPLNISTEFGQFNSDKFDNSISVRQNLRLPNFYKNQKQVLEEEWKNSLLQTNLQKWEIKREISLIYNELVYQDEKRKLLKKVDSIYSNYYKKADIRLKKGESNILEKTTAENYRMQAQLQINQLEMDREITINQFNYLLQDKIKYQNEMGKFYSLFLDNIPENYKGNPVIMAQLEQQKNIENAKLKAEKSKLLPSFHLGINSMTMAGTTDNNSKRFQSGVLGIDLPIFNSAQKSVIEGQKINQLIAENNYNIGLKTMEMQFAKLINEHQKLQQEQNYYLTKGLANAETILKTANQLFYEGEINYLEWSILVNQSLEIKNKYIDNQKNINANSIEINSLKGL
jgi:cobalt-zinc-cadmium efflux system outer membrane protein